ncbi:MAG: hypothetical protein AB7S55_10030, partial [Thiomonas sp.]
MTFVLRIAVDAPGLPALDYTAPAELPAGTLVRVPLGRQVVTGVVLAAGQEPQPSSG